MTVAATTSEFRPEPHVPIDLSLGCPSLGDLFAKNLAELKQVKRLSLAGSGLTDAGIKHLTDLTNLESLDLRRTKASAAGIAELQKALPKCPPTRDPAPDLGRPLLRPRSL